MISSGELSIGMFVTIHHWHERECASSLFSPAATETKTYVDHSWCGDVLEVIAIALPYIRVKFAKGYIVNETTLDTRQLELMELPEEFVR